MCSVTASSTSKIIGLSENKQRTVEWMKDNAGPGHTLVIDILKPYFKQGKWGVWAYIRDDEGYITFVHQFIANVSTQEQAVALRERIWNG